jgi:phage gpG-like protein
MAKIQIDSSKLAKLNNAIHQAFDIAAERLGDDFNNAITAEVYEWPRETERSDRSIAGSPRDIVDTEQLLDSLSISRTSNAASYEWTVEYAAAVHDGATLSNGTELPARPWTKIALEETDVVDVFAKQIEKRL